MKSNEERVKNILKKAGDYKMKKKKEGYAAITCVCAVMLAVVFGINSMPLKEIENIKDRYTELAKISDEEIVFNNLEELELTKFSSKEDLINKMKNSAKTPAYRYYEDMVIMSNGAMAKTTDLATDTGVQEAESNSDYSETNTQVKGVDESDIVKTNGDYIYYLSDNVLRIFENKESKIKLIKEINYNKDRKDNDEYVYAYEMYLTDKYVVVIAKSSIDYPFEFFDELENTVNKMTNYYYPRRNSTKVLIYDVENYDLVREIETEGGYTASRKVDDDIYLITNKYIYYYRTFDENEVMPLYRDTCIASGEIKEVAIDNIRCFPSFEEDEECSYMIITSFSLDNIDEKANVETFIGTGREIYCSKNNLYVTKVDYDYKLYNDYEDSDNENKTETKIRKFAIYDGEIKYVAEGTVPGMLLNQFSMDEYENNFRITTTKGETWDNTSENNLYVLNEKLKVIGKLEGLAKGEKIYSTRFMGDKCYVVTYKTVDPLFVLDLSNPEKPVVLGELKIPGYSKYLHPLGENYLIGFGEDSVEKTYKNYDGTESVTAYVTGLKLAIFDVSDYNNPKELDSVKIGGRGSYSELLYNHKSLLFKEDEGIFAFPAELYETNAGYYEDGVPKYGKLEFSGALVFDLSIEDGIKLRGKISNGDKVFYGNIERIIYIGDKLYTLSNDMIKASDIKTLEEIEKIEF